MTTTFVDSAGTHYHSVNQYVAAIKAMMEGRWKDYHSLMTDDVVYPRPGKDHVSQSLLARAEELQHKSQCVRGPDAWKVSRLMGLPDDLIGHILSFLCIHKVLTDVRVLSRGFMNLVDSEAVRVTRTAYTLHCRNADDPQHLTSALMAMVCHQYPNLTRLELGTQHCHDIKGKGAGLPLPAYAPGLSPEALRILARGTRGNLRALVIRGQWSKAIRFTDHTRDFFNVLAQPRLFAQLHTLDLRGFAPCKPVMHERLFKNLVNLRSLRVQRIDVLTLVSIVSLCRLSKFTIASLERPWKLPYPETATWRYPEEVDYLSIRFHDSYYCGEDDYGFLLKYIIAPCTRLTTLKLKSNSRENFVMLSDSFVSPALWYRGEALLQYKKLHPEGDKTWLSWMVSWPLDQDSGSDSDDDDFDDTATAARQPAAATTTTITTTDRGRDADGDTDMATDTLAVTPITQTHTRSETKLKPQHRSLAQEAATGLLPRLKTLVLYNVILPYDTLLAMTCANASTLEELIIPGVLNHDMSGSINGAVRAMRTILKRSTRLRRLHVSGKAVEKALETQTEAYKLQQRVSGLLKACFAKTSVTELRLTDIPWHYGKPERKNDRSHVGPLDACRHLDLSRFHRVELVRCQPLTDDDMSLMLQNVGHIDARPLHHLHIAECPNLTEAGIRFLALSAAREKLRYLYVDTDMSDETRQLFDCHAEDYYIW